MKKFAVLTLILVIAMILPNIVGAQGEDLPGTGWWTGQQIMNIGTADATISSTAYAKDGTATYVANADSLVKPGASVTFLPDQFSGMTSGFIGSAVVSSDQAIKAIVNLSNRQIGNYGVAGGAAFGQYQGMDGTAAATTLRFPLAKKDWAQKTNTFFIQNAGTAPAKFTIAYVCKDIAGAVTNFSETTAADVAVGRMAVMGPANVATMPAARLCAATVTSTQAMAGVAVEHWTTESPATLVQALRAFTPNDYAPVVYAPLFKQKFPPSATQNRTTGAQIMNVGAAAVDIKATFYGAMLAGEACPAGQTYTETKPGIAPGDSANFLNPAGLPNGCLASAKFEAVGGGAIVGVINESYLSPIAPKGVQAATAYNLAAGPSATQKVVFPLFKEKFAGKTTGLQVQNVGGAEATLTVVFKAGTSTWTLAAVKVKPGASANFLQVSTTGTWVGTPMPAGTNAGATITADQNILGYASESPYPSCYATPGCFDKSNYEGFNVNP